MSDSADRLPEPQGSDGAHLGPFSGVASAALSVKLDIFEGPLDLLLFLIRRDEIDIADIPIAQITSEYLAVLKLMEWCDLEVAGEYILMAATLIRIKSAMLLPRDPDATEDEDPRDELIQALIEYRKFKEAATGLKEKEDGERNVFARADFSLGPPETAKRFAMDQTLFDLLSAMRDVLARVEPETFHRVEIEDLTVDERIVQLENLLDERGELEFASLFLELPARWLVVVTFLALLEMARTRRISLRQPRPFAEIVLTRPVNFSPEVETVE
jgi:segregation and condensation protein A